MMNTEIPNNQPEQISEEEETILECFQNWD